MRKIIAAVFLACWMLLLTGCTRTPDATLHYRVTLHAGGTAYAPGLQERLRYTAQYAVANPQPFEAWLDAHMDSLPLITYAGDIEIVLHGVVGSAYFSVFTAGYMRFGESVVFFEDGGGWDGFRLIPLRGDDFDSDGVFRLNTTGWAQGVNILYVDIAWHQGRELTTNRYVFQVQGQGSEGFLPHFPVVLYMDGVAHTPLVHVAHSTSYLDDGRLVSASGIPFMAWLGRRLSYPPIPYSGNLQVVISPQEDGGYTRVTTLVGPYAPYAGLLDGMYFLPLAAEAFTQGVAEVVLPPGAGTVLLHVELTRSRGREHSRVRYVFIIDTCMDCE